MTENLCRAAAKLTNKSTKTGPRSAARLYKIFLTLFSHGYCSSVGRVMDCGVGGQRFNAQVCQNFFVSLI